ncbi:N-acetylglucosamine kinase [Endozoicomonas arenosclerae]|uniref:N-acetylglucosamine kinase n=1 Tax=Endozoicomonas arenosclerae TaxID=1633495 RepID=UPI000784CB27|nr:N-acetylglucosamine kinase [Endozoicomonas arenosclerae]
MLYGLDIGGTKMELAVFDHEHNKLASKRVPTPTDSYDAFENAIKELVLETDRELNTRGSVGLGIPGFINPDTGKAQCANVPCANNQNLQVDLELILDRPIKIENDANCFALSEAIGGAGDGFSTVFGVILGTGCGGGLYINGKLHNGRNNLAGEWGHTPLPYHVFKLAGDDFPIVQCGCGMQGCLDNYLSGRGLELAYKHVAGEALPGKDIVQLFRRHDTQAERAVEIYCELLASGLGAMINILDPGVIVLGGGLSNFDELYELVPPLLEKYTLNIGQLPEIRKAEFGDAGGVRGAAMLNA